MIDFEKLLHDTVDQNQNATWSGCIYTLKDLLMFVNNNQDLDTKSKVIIKRQIEDEIKQRKAMTFFGKINNRELKENLNYKFKKSDRDNYYSRDTYGRGIQPSDCREQLREWASYLAKKEAEKTPEGKKVKELELYKQSAINSVFECGVPEQLNIVLEKVLNGVGIIWNKTKALQLENKSHN